MAKKKLNIALIGAQFMGKAHSNAWQRVGMFFDPPVEPVMKVLCGKFPEELEVAGKWGWEETALNWKQVVNRPDIDIVDICTPNSLHSPIAIGAAKAGKHVICEKPLADTLPEAKDMLAAVKKAGVKHMCAFSYRFAPAVATIKNMIARGELGEIYHFRAAYQQDWIVDPDFPINWRLQKKLAGSGSLGDLGAHIVDLCHHLVGPIDEVSACLRTFIDKRPIAEGDATIAARGATKTKRMGKVDVDDAATFLATLKGANTMATFEVTRFAPGRRNHNSIEVNGSKGSVLWNQEDMNVFHYYNGADPDHVQGFRRVHATDPGHPYTEAWWPSGHVIGYEHLFVHEMRDFISTLKHKKAAYPTFEDGLACQKVLEGVVRAAKSKKWEKIR